MNFKNAIRNMGQLQAMTKSMLLANVIMAAGLVYAIVAVNGQRERVILVPPNLDKRAEIAWKAADKEYIKSFALYIAVLVGNMQPKSSAVILDSVSAFMDPAIYHDFRRQLLTLIEDPVFKASGSVISFIPSSIQYEAETSRVFVTGTIITSTSGAQKYQKQVTYELGVLIREGRPWVAHFLSYEGTIPRTVGWHVNLSTREGKDIPEYALPYKMRKNSETPAPAADLSGMLMDESALAVPVDQTVARQQTDPAPVAAPESTPVQEQQVTDKEQK